VLANRLTLDSQGRLILRDNGKIVLPFEHFANAVMLKHMSGPHGLHLSVDATVRAVIESYTIGRDQFGMEKEFIIEVVQSCPSPACRYYKNHMGISPMPFMEQQYPGVNTPEFLQRLSHLPPGGAAGSGPGGSATGSTSSATSSSSSANVEIDLSKSTGTKVPQVPVPPQLQHLTKQQQSSIQTQLSQISAAAAHHQQQQQQQHSSSNSSSSSNNRQQPSTSSN